MEKAHQDVSDRKLLNRRVRIYGDDIAAVIVEPIAGNMGLVLPEDGLLAAPARRNEETRHSLIFDEVMCGFRSALHGAQSLYHIEPDMTTLGKIIGGGLPVAAYGGKKASWTASRRPARSISRYLSGNPLAMQPDWKHCASSRKTRIRRKSLRQNENPDRRLKAAADEAGARRPGPSGRHHVQRLLQRRPGHQLCYIRS